MLGAAATMPRIAWVQRTFLDYRVPVLRALDELTGGRLHFLFSEDSVPRRCAEQARRVLGDRAVGLRGEWRLGREDRDFLANGNLSVRIQPGLARRIARIAPDVVVGNGFFKWTTAALCRRMTRGTPLVVLHERTQHTERNAQWYRVAYRRAVLRFTDALCASGSLCLDYLRSLGVPRERITLGHMVVDTDTLREQSRAVAAREVEALRRSAGLSGTVITYVGRMIPLKGLRELLCAWRALGPEPGTATLLLVGDGELEAEMKDYCETHGIGSVRFAGRVDPSELTRIHAASDAFVMPTLEDNWSLAMAEAMACGKPVLCSKWNGSWPELVQPGANGWLFDPQDPPSITRALGECIARPDRLSGMGRRSAEILGRYTPATAAQSILGACRIALQGRQAGVG